MKAKADMSVRILRECNTFLVGQVVEVKAVYSDGKLLVDALGYDRIVEKYDTQPINGEGNLCNWSD